MNPSRRWWISSLFGLALAALAFLGWSTVLGIDYPQDGIISWYSSGLIRELDPNGPAAGKLMTGDIILSVDGVPVSQALPFYVDKTGGDPVRFMVERDGQQISVVLQLIDPPLGYKINQVMLSLVALLFLLAGAGVLAFSPIDQAAELFFLYCLSSGALITAGAISYQGPPWVSTLFNVLLWLTGPLALHFHLYFPQAANNRSWRRALPGIYGIAVLFGLPYLLFGIQAVRASQWHPILFNGSLAYLTLNLIGVVALLAYAYRNAESVGVRGKIRIVVLGGLLTALPLITLTILPDVLFQETILPYSIALLLLGVIPLIYGYAIVRHRLVSIDRHVNRSATFILVISILGGFYLILYASVYQLIHLPRNPLVNTLLALVLAGAFHPLRQQVQRFVDKIFYGGWYDYRSAVTSITQGLEQITGLVSLGETVGMRLARTLRLEKAWVYLRELDGSYTEVAVASPDRLKRETPSICPKLPKGSLTYFLKLGLTGPDTLRRTLSEATITREERQLIWSDQATLFLPIIGHGQVLGLVVLGSKFAGDVFSGEDLDILQVVARHTSPLIENIHLVTRLKLHAADLEKRVADRTAELHAAKEHVEAILKSVGEGVVVTDLEWNVVTVNPAFEKNSGFTAEEILRHKLWDFFSLQGLSSSMERIQAVLQGGAAWSGELSSQRKDGRMSDIYLTISPVRGHQGELTGYVGSQRDITHQKELDRLKDRLILDVSHELRTPVTNLNLYLELVERGRPEKQGEYLATLKAEAGRLTALIEQILELSRLELWKSKNLALSAVDLNLVTGEVVVAHRPLAEISNLELTYNPGVELPAVRGEQNQLCRLVTNLLSNAIHYTQAGQVLVRTYREGDQVCLEVRDTGMGIAAEDLPHIFNRFYRGQQLNSTRVNGSGIGLAIVKEIVEIHAGRISVESEPCKGTRITIWLPTASLNSTDFG